MAIDSSGTEGQRVACLPTLRTGSEQGVNFRTGHLLTRPRWHHDLLHLDEFRWLKPVRPGNELRIESEVLEVRPSRSRPHQGLIKLRTTTLNQNDEAVQVQVGNLVVPRRQSLEA